MRPTDMRITQAFPEPAPKASAGTQKTPAPETRADARKMMTIGITGGVGSGKSTVLDFLAGLRGVRVIEADRAGHLAMEPGTDCYAVIKEHFGARVIDGDGRIDRKLLGQTVFADREELSFLNGVIHPAVKKYIKNEIARAESDGEKRLFVIEAALLIEDHYDEICDELWYVYADSSVRQKRLASSRGYTEEKTKSVMNNQLSDEVFREYCAEVIDNSGPIEDTVRQTQALLRKKGLEEVLWK